MSGSACEETVFITSLTSRKSRRAFSLVLLMMLSTGLCMEIAAWEAMALNDQDGDGLSYGLEYLINTQPQDPDSDNDGLPDGWEWKYGLDPTDGSSIGVNGATGDQDGDGVIDELDECPETEKDSYTDKKGCAMSLEDAREGGYTPGFTTGIIVISLLSAAMLLRRREIILQNN